MKLEIDDLERRAIERSLGREAVTAQAELERYKIQTSTQVEGAKVEAAKANERASEANARAAELDKTAAQLRLDLEKERNKTAMRPWAKDQFDAIQDIKGVVKDVGILWGKPLY